MSPPSAASPLLTRAILPTLLRLSVPNVLAMAMSVIVGIAEMSYIGILGTGPLAAMAVVFPFVMLAQMMSSGAMGGGVSSAISRALGAGDQARADSLAMHAVLIGAVAGLLFSFVFLSFGSRIFWWLGARGEVLELAIGYAHYVFVSAVFVWLLNTLASVLRGTGNMVVPSTVIFVCAILQILIGGALGLGIGPVPRFGLPGVAWGQLLASAAGVVFLVWWLRAGQARVRPGLGGHGFNRQMFGAILKVGALACLSPVQSVLSMLIFTGLIARLGVEALAGYGIGQRMEFLLIPIAFGIGVSSVPMVGMAIGANDITRARRVAWTAGGVSAAVLGAIGIVLALAPHLWAGMFSGDAAVLAVASNYLRIVGPAFACFGLGLTLYFASQGSGKVLGPVLAASLRLLLIACVGVWLVRREAEAEAYFMLASAGMLVYGLATWASVRFTAWGRPT